MSNNMTVIIQPTTKCNLNCTYCFAESEQREDMSEGTLDKLLTNIFEFRGVDGFIQFIWEGGEPLVRGIDFFRKVVHKQKEVAKAQYLSSSRLKSEISFNEFVKLTYKNSVQTNGTLITEEWINLFTENDFKIGISLDGPEEIHNKTRQFHNNKNSFEEVIKGARLAQNANILSGIITTLSKMNINYIEQIYEFMRLNQFNFKINPLLHSDKVQDNIGITPSEYGKAQIKLFNISHNQKTIRINPLEMIIYNLQHENIIGCIFNKNCQEGFINIKPNGDVYPCLRINNNKQFHLGNILHENIRTIITRSKDKYEHIANSRIKKCNDCEYQQKCNSGCMTQAYYDTGKITDRDYYCEAYKQIFKHITKKLKL